jgi:DNA (cytosine-5)-methyltransferase 1
VFVVGCLGDWRSAAAVLFERESLSGNPAPSREKGQATPTSFVPSVASCLETTCHDYSRADGFNMIAAPIALAENKIGRQPMNGGNGDGFTVAGPMYTLNATGVHGVAQPVYELHGQDSRVKELKDVCGTVSATYGMGGGNIPVTVQPIGLDEEQNAMVDCFGTLKARTAGGGFEGSVMQTNMAVRRLTPVECERLQGFHDNYTNIPWRKQATAPDGPRYKALGNSMAVPVMKWIGSRIHD